MSRRKLPKYVHGFLDRHDRPRHYFRRGSTRTTLPGLPWSAEFMMAHAEALQASEAPAKPVGRRSGAVKRKATASAGAGTFSKLIAEYRASTNFTGLAASTAQTYGRLLDRLDMSLGKLPVAKLDMANVERMVEIRAQQGGPEAGNNLRRILKALMPFAIKRNFRADDPTVGVAKVKRPNGSKKAKGFRAWTEDDIEKFAKKFPLGTIEYLSLAILICTGQRRSDIVRMGPASIVGKYDPKDFIGRQIKLTQQKTGVDLILPIAPMLAEALSDAAVPPNAEAFLRTRRQTPFTPESFTNAFSKWAKAAGIKGQASPHGLRKAAARRLAEAGCSVKLIAAVTGHTTLKEIERYTNAADQESMAKLAFAQLQSPKGFH